MLQVGDCAPNFTLVDLAGQEHRLTDVLARGPVVLAFMKADCATCRLVVPYLERLRQTYRQNDWHLWGISQHPVRATEWFARSMGVTFPLLIDGEGFPVSCAYDPLATPAIFLIDGSGMVKAVHTGLVKHALNALAGQLAQMIGEPPVTVAPPDDGVPSFKPG